MQQNITNGFSEKKFLQGKWVILGPKMMHWIQIWIPSKEFFFFLILHNKRGQEVHRNYINGFSGKKFLQGKRVILGPKIMCRHNSGLTARIF